MSYRKIYSKHWNTEIPKGFEIHHIDENRSNNNPLNLLALPKELHQNYHRIKGKINQIPCNWSDKISIFNAYNENLRRINLMAELNVCISNCHYFLMLRNEKIDLIKHFSNGTSF